MKKIDIYHEFSKSNISNCKKQKKFYINCINLWKFDFGIKDKQPNVLNNDWLNE